MKDVVYVVALVCLYFGGAILVSYCMFWYFASKQADPCLAENTSVKLVGPGGTYRCHYLRRDDDFLIFSNPLQADRFVPIRPGEKMMVCSASSKGFVTFSTQVLERDANRHELKLALPNFIKRSERRAAPRLTSLKGEDVLLDGEPAEIVDHSPIGMCVLASDRPQQGEVVHVALPSHGVSASGWAVDAVPASIGKYASFKVHIQFQEEQTFSQRLTKRLAKQR